MPVPQPAVACRQAGVFTRRQAAESGLTYGRIRRLIDRRDWVPILGSAFVVAGAPVSPLALAWAAALVGGGVVSHTTAARVWGIDVGPDALLHVVRLGRAKDHEGLHAHRLPLGADERCNLDGLAVATRFRTIVDCLAWLPYDEARALMHRALQQRWIGPDSLAREVRARFAGHGMPQLRRLLQEATTNPHSVAEARLHELFRRSGIVGWAANVPVRDSVGLIGVVDVLFAEARLVVEVDGRRWHDTDERFQSDRTRQNRLVNAGYTVLRFTWADLRDRPDDVVVAVRRALAQASR